MITPSANEDLGNSLVMKLLVTLAVIFILLNAGIWGLYFFGGNLVTILSIPDAPKPLTFEKPIVTIKVDLPIPEGEKVLLVKKGKTRGLDQNETLVVTQESSNPTFHVMIFDAQKALLYERKLLLLIPSDILVKTYEQDTHPSFYLVFSEKTPGYFIRWTGYQYAVPENEKDLSSR